MEHLFAGGFATLTMAELAARLNCSLRTLYALAPSRDELVLVVVDRNLWRVGRAARDAVRRGPGAARRGARLPGGGDGGGQRLDRGVRPRPGGGPGGAGAGGGPQRVPVRRDPHPARPRRGAGRHRRRRHRGRRPGARRPRPVLLPPQGDLQPGVIAEGGGRRGGRPRAAGPAQPLPERMETGR